MPFPVVIQRSAEFLAEVVLAPNGFLGEPFDPPDPPLPDPDPCARAEEPPVEMPPVPPGRSRQDPQGKDTEPRRTETIPRAAPAEPVDRKSVV